MNKTIIISSAAIFLLLTASCIKKEKPATENANAKRKILFSLMIFRVQR